MATTAMERMRDVTQQYRKSTDLMQNAANEAESAVNVQDLPGRRPQGLNSFSKPAAANIQNHNVQNHKVVNSYQQDMHSEKMDKQIQIGQQQVSTMKELHSTMGEILNLLQRDANKINPNYQAFSGAETAYGKAANDATAGGDGKKLISGLGEAIGGALAALGAGKLLSGNRGGPGGNRGGNPNGAPRGWMQSLRDRFSGGGANGGGTPRGPRLRGVPGVIQRGFNTAGNLLRNPGVQRGAVVAATGATAYGVHQSSQDTIANMPSVHDSLGSVSAGEESSRGVFEISTGRGDHGGVSYGTHQLATNNGSMSAFLQSREAAPYASAFQGMRPGTAAFNAKYTEVAQNDPDGFAKAQKDYITRTHFAPVNDKLVRDIGVDLSGRGRAVQEMMYSTGVQYGPGTTVIRNALRGKEANSMTDAEIIQTVQDYKAATTGTYFRSSPYDTQIKMRTRAIREKGTLLALDRQVQMAKANGEEDGESAVSSVSQASAPEVAAAVQAPVNSAPQGAPIPSSPTVAQATPDSDLLTSGTAAMGVTAAGAGAVGVGSAAADRAIRPATPPTPAPNAPRSGMIAGAGKGALRTAGRAVPYANVAIGAYDAYEIINDENATRPEKEKALSETAGGMGGAAAGASAGAALGLLGGPAAPVTVPLGGLIGGAFGYWGGSSAGGAIYDGVAGSPEEQAAREAARANSPANGRVPTSSLVDSSSPNRFAGDTATAAAVDRALSRAMTVQSDLVAERPVENGVVKAVDPAKVDRQLEQAKEVATLVGASSAALAGLPTTPESTRSLVATQTPTGHSSSVMGAVTATMAGLATMGLPDSWKGTITEGLTGAMETQDRAMAGEHMPVSSSRLNTPVKAAPASMPLPASSPASAEFYRESDISTNASVMSAPVSASTVQSSANAPSANPVTAAGSYAAPVERTQHDPVKKVMMIEPKAQNTMMPERMSAPSKRTPASGISESNYNGQTINECPAVITDDGLVLLQVGFI